MMTDKYREGDRFSSWCGGTWLLTKSLQLGNLHCFEVQISPPNGAQYNRVYRRERIARLVKAGRITLYGITETMTTNVEALQWLAHLLKGQHYNAVREQIEALDWDGWYPEVDIDGDLTGEIIEASDAAYSIVDVTPEGVVARHGASDAMIRSSELADLDARGLRVRSYSDAATAGNDRAHRATVPRCSRRLITAGARVFQFPSFFGNVSTPGLRWSILCVQLET